MSVNATTSQEYFDLHGKHYDPHTDSPHCAECNCHIPYKTASLDAECGLSVYNYNNKTNIPLKWGKYNKKDE